MGKKGKNGEGSGRIGKDEEGWGRMGKDREGWGRIGKDGEGWGRMGSRELTLMSPELDEVTCRARDNSVPRVYTQLPCYLKYHVLVEKNRGIWDIGGGYVT